MSKQTFEINNNLSVLLESFDDDSDHVAMTLRMHVADMSSELQIHFVSRQFVSHLITPRVKDLTNYQNGQCAIRNDTHTQLYGVSMGFGGDFNVEMILPNNVADQLYAVVTKFMDGVKIPKEFDDIDNDNGDLIGDLIDAVKSN
jgi:hypothetical protein